MPEVGAAQYVVTYWTHWGNRLHRRVATWRSAGILTHNPRDLFTTHFQLIAYLLLLVYSVHGVPSTLPHHWPLTPLHLTLVTMPSPPDDPQHTTAPNDTYLAGAHWGVGTLLGGRPSAGCPEAGRPSPHYTDYTAPTILLPPHHHPWAEGLATLHVLPVYGLPDYLT